MATHDLFVYGTLMFPPVMRLVTGCVFPTRAARLEGYQRLYLRGATYPGLIAAPAGTKPVAVSGLLCSGVGGDSLQRIDAYEDDLYERVQLQVEVSGADAALTHASATCYVVADRHRARLTEEVWDPARFEREHLAAFLNSLR